MIRLARPCDTAKSSLCRRLYGALGIALTLPAWYSLPSSASDQTVLPETSWHADHSTVEEVEPLPISLLADFDATIGADQQTVQAVSWNTDAPGSAPHHCVAEACNQFTTERSAQQWIRFRGGLTYLNRRSESHLGGTYGLDGIVGLTDRVGAHWATRVNQFSGATQLQGTLGLYRTSDSSGDMLDRIGTTILLDGFHDSRGDDFFLSQVRGQMGYAISEDSALGMTFTAPLSDEDNTQVIPGGGTGSHTSVKSVGVFVAQYFGDNLLQLNVGHRELPDSFFVDAAVRKPILSDRVFLYGSGNYVENTSAFAVWAGLEIRFGKRACGCDSRPGVRSVWDDPTISNAFNYGENSFWHNTSDPEGAPGALAPPPEEEEEEEWFEEEIGE
ncbi:hypothetical protein NHH03_10450 [Stieleria sp. TO1_6]|uniref:hypothetical protein n=1 Tax=Stieleria tagensis TaxID=2956795 RepID=UPI00209B5433|nr:hypothetical protein [Stieleria tagensis]MCO8122158.1 hypothetical protein [Stieleria tagensis]